MNESTSTFQSFSRVYVPSAATPSCTTISTPMCPRPHSPWFGRFTTRGSVSSCASRTMSSVSRSRVSPSASKLSQDGSWLSSTLVRHYSRRRESNFLPSQVHRSLNPNFLEHASDDEIFSRRVVACSTLTMQSHSLCARTRLAVLGVPLSLYLWYFRCYRAGKTDRAFTYLVFFCMYFVHICFCIYAALGFYPKWAFAGIANFGEVRD